MCDISMYDLSVPNKITYCNWRIGMVFNGAENYKFSHHHNIVNFISTRPVGDQPLKCFPIAHQHFQSPRASGRPLKAHPVYMIAFQT